MSDLLSAYNATIEGNPHLNLPTDQALVEAGRSIASQVDFAIENLSGADVTKALYLIPPLINTLREMKATPLSRQALTPPPKNDHKPKGALASVSNIPRPAN